MFYLSIFAFFIPGFHRLDCLLELKDQSQLISQQQSELGKEVDEQLQEIP